MSLVEHTAATTVPSSQTEAWNRFYRMYVTNEKENDSQCMLYLATSVEALKSTYCGVNSVCQS